jgi:glycine/D-amino acid oxidase-like deaminating enzyme
VAVLEYEVIIIGSGVVGSSIAYHLSEKKDNGILVIDKSFPLSGTSGSTQAWVWVHDKTPNWYGELSMYSAELYPYLEKKIGDVEYHRTGGISPFFLKEDHEKAKRLASKQAEVGIHVKVLTREEVLAMEPALSPKIEGATFSSLDGNVNPFRLVELYVRASKKNNVQFSFYNPVTSLEKKKETFIVTTEKGVFKAKKLIIAGGVWSKQLAAMLEVDIPIKQVRGQILITEPLAPLLKYTIGGMRQTINGEVLMGYSMEHVGYDRRSTLNVLQETAKMAIDLVPSLEKANIVRGFSGVRVIPVDGLPILGEVPSVDGLYAAVTHSGITLSPIIGTLMTELIMEGDTSLPIERYRLDRFSVKA